MRRPCEICNLQQTMHMDMHVLKINKQLFCILQTLSPPIHFASSSLLPYILPLANVCSLGDVWLMPQLSMRPILVFTKPFVCSVGDSQRCLSVPWDWVPTNTVSSLNHA